MNNRAKTRNGPVAPNSKRRKEVTAALKELVGEDSLLGAHLLDAAVAGAILARNPSNKEARKEAVRVWTEIEAIISHHLTSEDDVVLPWAELQPGFPRKLIERAHERLGKLRRLARTVHEASFARGSNPEIAQAGRALCAFAVHLDDLIDGEERSLFPMLQRTLFKSTEPAA
ncbi:MAG TPA: hemerythrin domain-containing protein [Candidatus Binataceae bacterium]|nr:hemerythrin domain-containing protein [Candidatus Binataceae bacterium]